MPFDGKNRKIVYERVKSGIFRIPKELSTKCVDFLKRTMCVDPEKRLSANEALIHPWIKDRGGLI